MVLEWMGFKMGDYIDEELVKHFQAKSDEDNTALWALYQKRLKERVVAYTKKDLVSGNPYVDQYGLERDIDFVKFMRLSESMKELYRRQRVVFPFSAKAKKASVEAEEGA